LTFVYHGFGPADRDSGSSAQPYAEPREYQMSIDETLVGGLSETMETIWVTESRS